MVRSNFHMHSTFCDGKDSLEAMVRAAVAAGLTDIGFTSHQPLPYPNDFAMRARDAEAYMAEVRRLKAAYAGQIAISLGMEIDYFIACQDIGLTAKQCLPELDYFIGSIHTVGVMKNGMMADIDDTPAIFKQGIADCYDGDTQAFVEAYYNALGQMAVRIKPDIIGHMDLIKKNNEENAIFDENAPWYRRAAAACLDVIAETDCIIEVNTGGMIRYGSRCRYPSDWLLGEIHKRRIPITLNGDSHSVDAVNYAYDDMEALLKNIGFKCIRVFKNGQWEEAGL